jgi:hypothetical protein
MLIAIHATDEEVAKIKQLKVLFQRRTNSDLLRYLIDNGQKILAANVSIGITAPVPVASGEPRKEQPQETKEE